MTQSPLAKLFMEFFQDKNEDVTILKMAVRFKIMFYNKKKNTNIKAEN